MDGLRRLRLHRRLPHLRCHLLPLHHRLLPLGVLQAVLLWALTTPAPCTNMVESALVKR